MRERHGNAYTVRMRVPICLALPTVVVALGVTPIARPAQPASADARVTGLYRDASGAPLIVWPVAPGRLAVGFGAGELRALSTDGTGGYRIGRALGMLEPVIGTLRPVAVEGGVVNALEWRDSSGRSVLVLRVELRETVVRFAGAAGVLAGEVIQARGDSAQPGLVLLHGSEAEDREGARAVAYWLAHRGIASLIYDKRGTGGSVRGASDTAFAVLAGDAVAALNALRHADGVRGDAVGLFGPSQGAWVALEATQQSRDVAFVVLQSGDATTPLEQEMVRGAARLRAGTTLTGPQIEEATAFRRLKFLWVATDQKPAGYDSALAVARTAPWFANVGAGLPKAAFWHPNGLHDPMPALRALNRPLLAVFGARDASKDVERNARVMRETFDASGNSRARVIVFADANHGLFETTTGLPLERELPALTRLVPGYLDSLAAFVHRAAAGPRRDR